MSEHLKTLAYLVVGAAFLVLAWAARPAVPAREAIDDTGEPFFPAFDDPLRAASLEIIEFDEETGTARAFKVARHEGVWSIPSHENYPADAENRFAEATAQMIGLEKGTKVSDRPADHELYGVVDPADAGPGVSGVGRRVTIANQDGRALADLIIGKDVRDSDGQHFVRVPGKDRVYLCRIDMDRFSTAFEDWIEKDLLQLTTSDITGIVVNDYAIDEFSQRLIQGDTLNVTHDPQSYKWTLEGLGEGEELDAVKLNEMRRALDDLEIVNVHRKPEGLSSELRAEDTLQLDQEAVRSLQSRGFYIVQGRLLSNQGETIVRTKDGVQYTLRFGEVVLSDAGGSDGGGSGRYLFVTAEFNEDLVPKPEIMEVPDLDALLPPDEPAGEGDESGEASGQPSRDEAIRLAEEKITEENERKQQEYDEKVAAGRARARELNARFADWYYVISDEVYGKIRLTRDDVVKQAADVS